MSKTDDLQILFLHPEQLTHKQITTIRKLARVVMEKYKCDYTKATLIAYVEWFEMAEMDKTEH